MNEAHSHAGDTLDLRQLMMAEAEPIIIIDDSKSVRSIVRKMLTDMGFSKITEFSGVEELLRNKDNGVKLILCDVEMAPISGLEFLAAIRKDEALKDVRFILMTGMRSAEYARAARRLGADGLLLKPFTQAVLERALRRCVLGT